MEQKEKTQKNFIKRVSVIVACVLFAAFGALFIGQIKQMGRQNASVDVVILGDSIMGKERVVLTMQDQLEEYTGLKVFNGALGGTCASICDVENRYSYHEDSLNLVYLADSICDRDFGRQLADLPNNQFKMDYFQDVITGLSEIDFTQIDMLLIEYGMNDYNGFRQLDDPNDPFNIKTYGGALRYSVARLKEAYPSLQIVMVTPSYCWIEGYDVCTRQDFGYGTMTDFAEKQIEIAKEYNLNVIDAFHDAGYTEENILGLTEDGAHPNETGRKLYGEFVAKEIMKLRN